jgi:hypothetical protein
MAIGKWTSLGPTRVVTPADEHDAVGVLFSIAVNPLDRNNHVRRFEPLRRGVAAAPFPISARRENSIAPVGPGVAFVSIDAPPVLATARHGPAN